MIKKTKPKTPKYWNQACRELSKKDKKLAHLISKYTNLKIQSHGDPFTTLTRSIVGQQISVAAAESIWKKLYHLEAKYCGKYPEGKPFDKGVLGRHKAQGRFCANVFQTRCIY